MPSNVPTFSNELFKRMLPATDEKGIKPFLVVTEERNLFAIWHVTSAPEVLLLKHFKHFRGAGARDAAIEFAAKWEG